LFERDVCACDDPAEEAKYGLGFGLDAFVKDYLTTSPPQPPGPPAPPHKEETIWGQLFG